MAQAMWYDIPDQCDRCQRWEPEGVFVGPQRQSPLWLCHWCAASDDILHVVREQEELRYAE